MVPDQQFVNETLQQHNSKINLIRELLSTAQQSVQSGDLCNAKQTLIHLEKAIRNLDESAQHLTHAVRILIDYCQRFSEDNKNLSRSIQFLEEQLSDFKHRFIDLETRNKTLKKQMDDQNASITVLENRAQAIDQKRSLFQLVQALKDQTEKHLIGNSKWPELEGIPLSLK